jgi:hypothetical protein
LTFSINGDRLGVPYPNLSILKLGSIGNPLNSMTGDIFPGGMENRNFG